MCSALGVMRVNLKKLQEKRRGMAVKNKSPKPKKARPCVECGVYPGEINTPLGKICAGCHAYQEHTGQA